jgi:hypothetical protein
MNNERVILIRGKKSNWYEQAIFIIKPGVVKDITQVDMVEEAERVINEYRERKMGVRSARSAERFRRGKTKPLVVAAAIIGAVGFAAYIVLSHV